jgi:hypothetical protein
MIAKPLQLLLVRRAAMLQHYYETATAAFELCMRACMHMLAKHWVQITMLAATTALRAVFVMWQCNALPASVERLAAAPTHKPPHRAQSVGSPKSTKPALLAPVAECTTPY